MRSGRAGRTTRTAADTANLDAALRGVDRVLLDSSALIAFFDATEAAHAAAVHLLRRVERNDAGLRGYVSVITATELLVRPFRAADTRGGVSMHRFLLRFPSLQVLDVDIHVAQQAATVRAATRLQLPDCLIVATGLLAGCQAIVSNDARRRARCAPLFPRFRWTYLQDDA
jgi:predicted nucleic acid-binding protein